MRRSIRTSLAVPCLLLLAACSVRSDHELSWSGERTLDRDTAAIAQLRRQLSAAYVRSDAPAMAGIYMPDAVILPDDSETIAGRERIGRYWALPPGERITHHQATPTEIRVEGDVAYEHGVYQVSGERQGRPWGPAHGKYAIVWRRQSSGEWRIHLDIRNGGPARQP